MSGTLKLRASKSHVWAKEDGCTGYTRLFENLRPESERDMSAVNEGIEAHDVLQTVLNNGGNLEGEGEMWTYAVLLADLVYCDRDATVYIETPVPTMGLNPRIDVATFNEGTKLLTIWEYKYGTSPVEVEANPQLLLGAMGLIEKFNLDVKYIRCHVYQPRGYHVDGSYRTWDTTPEVFIPFKELVERRINEYELGGLCRTGTHCLNCPAMLKCEAHTNSVMSAIEFTEIPEEWERDSATIGSEFQLVKRVAKLLEKRLSALKSEVEYLTNAGEHTGYYFIDKTTPLKWNYPPEEMFKISQAMGVDISKPVNIMTPKQAVDGKLISENDILNFATRPSSRKELKKLDVKEIERRFT